MCGLIAILDWRAGGWDSSLEATRAVHRGLEAMNHRGVRSFVAQDNNVIMGHRRLPIINLKKTADQPMSFNGVTGMFVGEVFNYQQFDKEALTDTEILLKRFDVNNFDSFHEYDGFWAGVFSCHGAYVVTDYLSQKPLYFDRISMTVASEPAAIIAAIETRVLDPVYFSNVLKWGYDPTGRTPWEGITQIPAGHVLSYTDFEGLQLKKYWDWFNVKDPQDLRSALVEATENRLVGDRRVGFLLSGGLDSTIIYKILTKILDKQVTPFVVENGENAYVYEATGGMYDVVRPRTVTIEKAVKAHQVPVDLGSMVPQLELAIAMSGDYVVAMSGDGADELFGGYRRAKEYDSQMSDIFMELPYYHLPRLDRIMMSQTVELRSPYLAPSIVKYAMGLPWSQRTEKQALKGAFNDIVPRSILDRKKHALKTEAVINGGIKYRQELINLWKNIY